MHYFHLVSSLFTAVIALFFTFIILKLYLYILFYDLHSLKFIEAVVFTWVIWLREWWCLRKCCLPSDCRGVVNNFATTYLPEYCDSWWKCWATMALLVYVSSFKEMYSTMGMVNICLKIILFDFNPWWCSLTITFPSNAGHESVGTNPFKQPKHTLGLKLSNLIFCKQREFYCTACLPASLPDHNNRPTT